MKHYQVQFTLFLYCKVWENQILIYYHRKEVGKGGKPQRSNENCKQEAANVTSLHKLAVQGSRDSTCKTLATHLYTQQKLCISLEVRTADCTAKKGKPYVKQPSNYHISNIRSSHRSLTDKQGLSWLLKPQIEAFQSRTCLHDFCRNVTAVFFLYQCLKTSAFMLLNHVRAVKSVIVLKQLTKEHFSISSRDSFSSTDDLMFPV